MTLKDAVEIVRLVKDNNSGLGPLEWEALEMVLEVSEALLASPKEQIE
jgi:hypothetical protein